MPPTPDARAGWLLALAALLLTALAPAATAAPSDEARGGRGGVEIAVRAAPSFTSTPVTDAAVGEAYSYQVTATDPDGDPLSFDPGTLPAWLTFDPGAPNDGAVMLQGTPAPGDVGDYNISILVSDGTTIVEQTFTLTVRPANNPPIARDDEAATSAGQTVTVDVLANDTDPDGDPLTLEGVSAASEGQVVASDQRVQYTPDAGFVGTDAFSYAVSDGRGGTAGATVMVTVTAANNPPTAQPDSYTTAEGAALTVDAPGVLANDTDPDGTPLAAELVTQPASGAVEFTVDGSFTYTPSAGFSGTDTFSYRASDGELTSDPVAVTITVTPANRPPTAQPNTYTTPAGQTLTTPPPGVLGNDSDPDGDPLSAQFVDGVGNGELALQPDGSFTYTPDPGFSGTDGFTYRASDGALTSEPVAVTIAVDPPANVPPQAQDDAAATAEDQPVTISVLANDTDPDGDPLSVLAVTQPSSGQATVTGGGAAVRYTPNPGFVGTDTFAYTATDGRGGEAEATVTVTVTNVNEAPAAQPDAYTVAEDAVLTTPPPGVLGNDTDPDGDPLAADLVDGPDNGVLDLRANGSFTYTPAADFSGTDGFSYRASDGTLASAPVAVTITVAPVDDPPVAQPDAYTVAEDAVLTTPPPGVLGNDADPDGDPLAADLVGGPSNGTLNLRPDGSFTYTPAPGFSGADGFTYRAVGGGAASEPVAVAITVTPVNDAPVARDDGYTVAEDAVLSVDAPGVLANDGDPDGDGLSAELVTGPSSGTLDLDGDGSFTYTPAPDFSGTATFRYRASDGALTSAPATVTITVAPVNDPPTAQPDVYTTAEDVPLSVDAPGVLANDGDPDSPTITAQLVTQPSNGTLDLRANGSFTYTPAPDFQGTDEFTYRASDGGRTSAAVPVRITVGGRNDPPVARDDAATTAEDEAVTINVLANDTDPDGDPLSVLAVTQPSDGRAAVTGGGAAVRYTPSANANGRDSFTYTVSDGNGGTATATVTVTVTPVNDRPVARQDVYVTDEDVVLRVGAPGVLGNDTDPDGDPLTAQLVTQPASGALDLRPDGSFTYRPAPDFAGTVTFRYRASDGTRTSSSATVTITVAPVDDPPLARPDVYVTDEDVALDVSASDGVLANDTDPDNTLSAVLARGPSNGALDLRANGSFTYTPDLDFVGRDAFTYQAVGGGVASEPVTVTIRVGGENDPPVAQPDAATTAEDTPVTIAVLDNDTDPDGDPLSVASVVQPSNGTATISPDGTTVVYTPNLNFNGADAFSYAASDGSGETSSASVSVTVTPVNDAPVAMDDAASTRAGEPVLIAVLANDLDVDGDALTVASVSAPASGRAAVEGGAVRYAPDAGFVGTDTFTYTVADGQGGAAEATVTVTVRPAGGAAVASEAGPARVGAPVTVAVAATAFTPSSADLFYRPAGGGAYRVTPLAPAEAGYAGTIPADAVTARGVDYYVVLSGDGARATDPAETPALDPRHVRVAIPRAEAPVAFERDGYRMVALPLVPETPTAAAVFADDLGPYDPTVWRLFRWDAEREAYDEFPDIAAPLVPGRGVWLAARAGGAFDVVDALSADASDPVALTLAPGWTQIGTPFGFAVAWDDIEGSEAVSPPVAWDGAEYVFDQGVLEPWRGYFVENPTDAPVTLTVPPVAVGAAARRAPVADAGSGYRLRLSVTAARSEGGAADLRDTQNVVGFAAAAAAGRDRLDWAEPPPPGPHVRLSLLADGARLARSLQPDGGGGAAWDAEVTASADLLAAPLALRVALDDERPLPDGYGRYVLDLDRGAALAADGGAVEVTLSAADPVRRLRVVVGTEAFASSVAGGVPLVAPAFGLERAAPNPVRAAATLAFSVPAPGPVTLDVVDVLGRRVAVLVDGERGAGRHEVAWRPDGLASGTYVVRLRAAGESATQTVTVVR
ncbi:Ig-like domain-containing protein [Rubrivirga sp. S365]|uniref:Ig-like domain-containing protein n=1 Tax=Rubrivirga sp. S365 TaxID=3076080 RepID=UPI0028C6E8E8|nr:Ig-like domain-containing protein [Rubrivirga sp. S365]MDT7855729.1 Ig-like domain-containing protein [Rubrivirga sp. S365]